MKTNAITRRQTLPVKYSYLFSLLLPLYSISLAQNAGVEQNVTRLNVTLIGVSGSSEFKLGKVTSLFVEGGLNTYAEVSEDDELDMTFSVQPFLQVEPRLYYSFASRERRNKKTSLNHGGFVALTGGYIFQSLNERYFKLNNRYFIGPVWGYNIVIRNKFSLETRLGIAYLGGREQNPDYNPRYPFIPRYNPDKQTILPITDLRFCFFLNRRKS